MAIKAEQELSQLHELLGVGGEAQVVPIFIPVDTFRLLSELAVGDGISVSDVLVNSIKLFIRQKQDIKEEVKQRRAPDIVVKRRK